MKNVINKNPSLNLDVKYLRVMEQSFMINTNPGSSNSMQNTKNIFIDPKRRTPGKGKKLSENPVLFGI